MYEVGGGEAGDKGPTIPLGPACAWKGGKGLDNIDLYLGRRGGNPAVANRPVEKGKKKPEKCDMEPKFRRTRQRNGVFPWLTGSTRKKEKDYPALCPIVRKGREPKGNFPKLFVNGWKVAQGKKATCRTFRALDVIRKGEGEAKTLLFFELTKKKRGIIECPLPGRSGEIEQEGSLPLTCKLGRDFPRKRKEVPVARQKKKEGKYVGESRLSH